MMIAEAGAMNDPDHRGLTTVTNDLITVTSGRDLRGRITVMKGRDPQGLITATRALEVKEMLRVE